MRLNEFLSIKKVCRAREGFILIEVLAVLALLALCAALLWPLAPARGRWNLEAAARGLASDLRLARQAAITLGDFAKIDFYPNAQKYQLRLTEVKQPRYLPEIKQTVHLPAGVYFEGTTSFTGDPPSVQFNSLGHPGGGGTVILKSGEGTKRYVIVLPVTGRVRISADKPEHWQ